jgi:hypothetical protein
MAELRYQLMEMIEQERELRAQTEQASVLRVVELESQVSFVFRLYSYRAAYVVSVLLEVISLTPDCYFMV